MKTYIKRTWKNKLAAIGLALIGYMPIVIDGDGTAMLFMLFLAVPLFLTGKKYI